MRYSDIILKEEALHKCCYICYRILFGDFVLIYLTKPLLLGISPYIICCDPLMDQNLVVQSRR